ncbi:amino acid ABC transporter substrate-binding protein [Cupriavidus consociatus]|uniref:amino acid ABC transporter substrate-binding protein n=1 Tax=Cupriavidus consociatus TaxID=2821357 RepID=UPI001AEA1415|nr:MULTISPECIES: amino acid ABC transporter substrate-binding protein [unclassified Cupriavidus]MBP0623377.1 amino acid ABC transporter substrate-binding protein [Cupriavidus sp. LEh25]MDK2660075.1 amino acid ABC transporter substrate-binding protein [Cupriavidus sp. LEh21]
MLKKICGLALITTASALLASPAHAGKTLDAVKQRGQLSCGVGNTVGMSAADSQGNWSGLDVDLCRAVAAAVLGDPKKVRWVPLTTEQRFTALQSGEVDILSRETTWTLSRDASLGVQFTGVNYYDGQGFMVPAKSGITSPQQLKGATVCTSSGTTTEKNLTDFSRAHGLKIKPVVFEKAEAVSGAYFSGRCDAFTSDATNLAAIRKVEAKNPADHVILPQLISKEPISAAVRRGDDEWASIVRWVNFGLIEAEEYGITQANVDKMLAQSDSPVVLRILGKTEDTGKLLGLNRDWMAKAIKAVGNYGEIYERNLGAKTPLNVPRGLNNLWNKGGIMFAPPIR